MREHLVTPFCVR